MWALAPWPGIEPQRLALGVRRISHWTTREIPIECSYHEELPDFVKCFFCIYWDSWDFPSISAGKECACNAGDPNWFLGQEDPLEKEMAIHSNILAWKIPWMEEPGQLQSMGHKESDTTEWLHFHFLLLLYLCQLDFWTHPGTLKGLRKPFLLSYKASAMPMQRRDVADTSVATFPFGAWSSFRHACLNHCSAVGTGWGWG